MRSILKSIFRKNSTVFVIALLILSPVHARSDDSPWYGDIPHGMSVEDVLKSLGSKAEHRLPTTNNPNEGVLYNDVVGGFDATVGYNIKDRKVSEMFVRLNLPEKIAVTSSPP
jgi:hypothetical protein